MPIDRAVSRALTRAVAEAGQPKAIAERLDAWLVKLSEGEDSDDVQKSSYDAVFAQLKTGADNEN